MNSKMVSNKVFHIFSVIGFLFAVDLAAMDRPFIGFGNILPTQEQLEINSLNTQLQEVIRLENQQKELQRLNKQRLATIEIEIEQTRSEIEHAELELQEEREAKNKTFSGLLERFGIADFVIQQDEEYFVDNDQTNAAEDFPVDELLLEAHDETSRLEEYDACEQDLPDYNVPVIHCAPAIIQARIIETSEQQQACLLFQHQNAAQRIMQRRQMPQKAMPQNAMTKNFLQYWIKKSDENGGIDFFKGIDSSGANYYQCPICMETRKCTTSFTKHFRDHVARYGLPNLCKRKHCFHGFEKDCELQVHLISCTKQRIK